MPTYLHLAKCCSKEFEDFYSIRQDPPTLCPFCQTEGQVQRLVSGGSGKGIVEITGHELKAKMRAEGQELKRAALKDESLLSNLIGHDKYEKNLAMDKKAKENRPKTKMTKSGRVM